MKTDKQIEKLIKNSLLSDNIINVCLHLHNSNKGMFIQFISKLEDSIKYIIDNNDDKDVYRAFLWCKENRVIRLSNDDTLEKLERGVIAMCGGMSKYRELIITGDLLSQIVVISE